jgi:hypothetical protein
MKNRGTEGAWSQRGHLFAIEISGNESNQEVLMNTETTNAPGPTYYTPLRVIEALQSRKSVSMANDAAVDGCDALLGNPPFAGIAPAGV